MRRTMKGAIIIIEGNISAGKTTLVKELGSKLNARTYIEPALDNPYLERFYKEPKKYALTMQIYLLQRRFLSYVDALKLCLQGDETVLLDRSIFSDYVFAVKNFKDGNITSDGFQYYLSLREKMLRHLPIPHATLYLDVPPEVCHDRILNMRRRGCESSIPLDYLSGLDAAYQEMLEDMRKLGSEVIITDWKDFGNVNQISESLEESLNISKVRHEKVYEETLKLLNNAERIRERLELDDQIDELYFDHSPSEMIAFNGSIPVDVR